MRLEVWHGGIPDDAPRPHHPHDTHRISGKPFSIPWPLWLEHHIPSVKPDLVVHVYPPKADRGEGAFWASEWPDT